MLKLVLSIFGLGLAATAIIAAIVTFRFWRRHHGPLGYTLALQIVKHPARGYSEPRIDAARQFLVAYYERTLGLLQGQSLGNWPQFGLNARYNQLEVLLDCPGLGLSQKQRDSGLYLRSSVLLARGNLADAKYYAKCISAQHDVSGLWLKLNRSTPQQHGRL